MSEGEVYTRQQRWGTYEQKEAEVGNMAAVATLPVPKSTLGSKTMIPKTGSAMDKFASALEGAGELVEEEGVSGEQPAANPQAAPISPRVDVSGKEPPKVITEKVAQHLAMPSLDRYPLDSYSDVVKAAAYFTQHAGEFSPAHSHEFCSNLVKRAHVLGISTTPEIEKRGGAGYAPQDELDIAMGTRALHLGSDEREVLDKLAATRALMEPEDFAIALGEFDKLAGIDHMYGGDVMDPFLSTFGTKTAAKDDPDGSHVIGNDVVSDNQLRTLAKSPCEELTTQFGADFVKEFKDDPVGIFSSLPVDQKKVLSRHANEPTVSN